MPVPLEPPDSDGASRWRAATDGGDRGGADGLLPVVYEQLRRAAQLHLARERPDHNLSATELVHEAYLKLAGPRELPWANRAHFYAAAAEAMRRILLDHARTRARSGGVRVTLDEVRDLASLVGAGSEEIVAVDAAIERLAAEDPEAAAVVRLRFYAGLGVDATAEALGLSPRTVARLWAYARAALYRDLSRRV